MEVVNYTENNFEDVSQMAKSHGITVDRDLLPSVGKVVPGLAAGFLYQTDSKLAFIDNVVSNAEAPSIRRARAVTVVISAIVHEARSRGFKMTASASSLSGICKTTARLGFKIHTGNFKLITRVL